MRHVLGRLGVRIQTNSRESRMNLHQNARFTPHGRELLVKRVVVDGLRPIEAAQAAGVSPPTVYKWLRRYRQAGWGGLQDRSSRPRRSPRSTPDRLIDEIIERRKERQTYRQIAQALGVGESTVGRWLARNGLNRLASLEPARPANRYEHEAPGDLLHLDIKRLGRFTRPGHRVTGNRQQHSRGAGWEYVHIAIDDHSRVAHATIHPDETGYSACRALMAAVRHVADRAADRARRVGPRARRSGGGRSPVAVRRRPAGAARPLARRLRSSRGTPPLHLLGVAMLFTLQAFLLMARTCPGATATE